MARFHVRAALGFHELGEYADDAEIITSELVTNAIRHVCSDGSETVGVILARVRNPESVTVVVSDSSPEGPVMREAPADSERGRGLQIVEALSAHWGWHPQDGGKEIFAVLAKEVGA
jgi:anti-sigma regulatory factor (Ser/Thr protein kinase)